MQGQNLRTLYESLGPVGFTERLTDCLDTGELKPSDFSIREIAEATCGERWVSKLAPKRKSTVTTASDLLEAGEGVDVNAFSDITGQIFFNKIMEGWKQATRVTDGMFQTIQSDLDGERMPWISHIPEEGEVVHPGMPFPEASLNERYIDTPNTSKRGMILSVTKEAIFFDRTGMLLRQASEVGERLGMNKEKRCLRVFLGLVNNYKLNGTAYNTYLTTTWTNQQASTPLLDFSSINQAYILASQILDPDTNNPIDIMLKDLFVMPALVMTAKRITSATQVRSVDPGFATTLDPNMTLSASPLPDPLSIFTSPIAYQLAYNAATSQNSTYAAYVNAYWWIGDFKKAFAYVQNWPLTVVQAPANSIKEFEQDIVTRFKASERGVAAVIEPRQVFRMYGTSAGANLQ